MLSGIKYPSTTVPLRLDQNLDSRPHHGALHVLKVWIRHHGLMHDVDGPRASRDLPHWIDGGCGNRFGDVEIM
jgi:hypothetical protein